MITVLKKMDIVLIIVLIVFAVAFYFIFNTQGDAGSVVVISVGGAVYEKLPLSEDSEVEIYLADGTHSNTLTIRDGEAYMTHADCPDGLCLKHSPVRLTGEMIVCLPNRIVAEISGGTAEFDAVIG